MVGSLLVGFTFWRLFFKRSFVETASGAIVMAVGIFVYRGMVDFSWLALFVKAGAAVLFSIWICIVLTLIYDGLNGCFYERHLKDPFNRFGVGTWIAGTSVLGNVFLTHTEEWSPFLRILTVFNIFLWLGYLPLAIFSFYLLFRTNLKESAHGLILLPAVSTQSVVILLHNVFPNDVPPVFSIFLIGIGLIFYIVGFYFIATRFIRLRKQHWIDEWLPSNCILHGAMSITGLACVTVEVISDSWVLLIWFWVLICFIVVEGIECSRAVIRIRLYGLVKGIGEYHVTQWSRIFTFGMLYTFTAAFQLPDGGVFTGIRTVILEGLPWTVLILLVNEVLLFLKEKMKKPSMEMRFHEKKA